MIIIFKRDHQRASSEKMFYSLFGTTLIRLLSNHIKYWNIFSSKKILKLVNNKHLDFRLERSAGCM